MPEPFDRLGGGDGLPSDGNPMGWLEAQIGQEG